MITYKFNTMTFTGHRNNRIDTNNTTLITDIENAIYDSYAKGYRRFMTGMAQGFDLIAAEAVLRIKNSYPDIKLIAIIPFLGQCRYFSDEDKQRYANIMKQCDKIKYFSKRYYTGCFHRRNDYLIDNSSLVISYFDGMKKGGTYYTIQRAIDKGLTIINICK